MFLEKPELEVIEFDAADIIVTSQIGGGDTCMGEDGDCDYNGAPWS